MLRGTALGQDTGGVEEVLPGDRHAVERAPSQAGSRTVSGCGRLGAGAPGRQPDEARGLQAGFLNVRQAGIDQIDRVELPGFDRGP